MLEVLKFLACLGIAAFIGYRLFFGLILRRDAFGFWERAVLSFALGMAAITWEMLILSFLNIKFSVATILAPLAALTAVTFFLPRRKENLPFIPREKFRNAEKLGLLEKFLIFGISFEVAYSFFRALIKPVDSYDSVAFWAMKAKVFFLERAVSAKFLTASSRGVVQRDYPLFIPLSETWVYTFIGRLNDLLVKAIFPLLFVGLLVLFYHIIRRIHTRKVSLLFTFLLASIPQLNRHASIGYVDMPLGFWYSISFLFLFMWMKERRSPSYIVLSSIMLGFAMWTKNEGAVLGLVSVAVLGIYLLLNRKSLTGKEKLWLLWYPLIPLVIISPWLVFKCIHRLRNDILNSTYMRLEVLAGYNYLWRLKLILYEMHKHIFGGVKKWNIVWLLVFLGFVFRFRKAFSGELKYLSMAILLIVVGYSSLFLVTPQNVEGHLCQSYSRLLLHYLPIAALWLAHIWNPEKFV